MSSQTHPLFNQRDYNNTFYYCNKFHPFIAFTTCFCPLCEKEDEVAVLTANVADIEDAMDNLTEDYYELIAKANKHAPELLI